MCVENENNAFCRPFCLCLQEAALSLEGEHDFRHFCKIDTSKPNVNIRP
jgi:tRNA U38,U39,U40 pseudouridine synthase TruA